MSVARRLLQVQRDLLALADQSARGAVANALQAAQDIVDAGGERRALTGALRDNGAEGTPGHLGILTRSECLELLASRKVGRLAYIARAGMPDIVPVNYALDGTDLLIRTGRGPKLQAAERREFVAFEVDDIDEQAHTGWSVVVVGRARRLTAAELAPHLAAGAEPQPWATGPRRHDMLISATRIDGRRLT